MSAIDLISFSVISGVCFLIASLVPVFRLLQITRSRSLRRAWIWLGIMIVGFIVGYLTVLSLLPRDTNRMLVKLICGVLVMGGVFVLSVSILALRTAMDVARLVHLEQEVVIDPLTGVYNRRFFDEQFPREVALAGRSGMNVSLLVIDLDHFKAVNDTHGHAAGDRVLSYVAALLSEGIRKSDMIVRYGGEEFVVIAPATDGQAAEMLADRLCRKVKEATVTCPGGNKIGVTISVGFATASDFDTEESFFIRADDAVYEAKKAGRNCARSGNLENTNLVPCTDAA